MAKKRENLDRPVSLREGVESVLNPGDRSSLEQRQRIRRVWEAALPSHLLAQTRLVDLRRKELWVEVSSSALSQELQFLKPRILAALAEALGPAAVREIRFRVGEF